MIRKILCVLFLTGTPAWAEPPVIVTDIAPVQSLVAQVMADVGPQELLLTQSSDPHDFQLRPSQARALARADLVIWIGPELTPWLARAIKGVGVKGKSLQLLQVPGTKLRDFPVPKTGGQTGGPTGLDPHAWLDPVNAQVWLDAIAAELAKLDPDNASLYRANASIAKASIDALTDEVAMQLAPVKGKPIIVFHNAYNYFAARFGLTIAGAIRPGDASAPGAAHLAALRKILKSGHVACAFGEPQENMAPLVTLLAGTGIRSATLDPVGSTIARGAGLYEALLTNMASTISDCVSGQ